MRTHIVAVGISKYQNAFVRDLEFAAKDAIEIFEVFESNIPEIGHKKLLIDSEATLGQIRAAVGEDLTTEAKPEDSFLFFYSGHGTTAEVAEEDALAHYLIPFDATRDFINTCISIDYLRQVFEKLPCQAKLVFIDSCFSGSINSKGYTNPTKKSFPEIKTFMNTVLGTGNVTFTACKDTEEAIEDLERQNGLFTAEVLLELTRRRQQERFAVADLFTPVTENVIKRAKERFRHIQTPTINSRLQGVLYFPVFKQRKIIAPQFIRPPRIANLGSVSVPVPRIAIENKKLEESVNELISMVTTGSRDLSVAHEIAFEKFCGDLIGNFKSESQKIMARTAPNAESIAASVADLEAAAHQIILLGGIIAVFGNEKQMQIFAEHTLDILSFHEQKSGYTAILAMPEIIIADLIYCVGIICLARRNLKPLFVYLDQPFFRDDKEAPQPLLTGAYYVHYCDALGGNATKVNDHVRQLLESYEWIGALAPRAGGMTMDLQLQINFLLSTLMAHKGHRFWPDFGRFYAKRLRKPLLQILVYDPKFKQQIATFFNVKEQELLPTLRKLLPTLQPMLGGSGYFWESIGPNDLMTEDDRKAAEKSKQPSPS